MKPKHSRTNYFLKTGIFDNLNRFSDLEKRISKLPTEKERGDAFEVFAEAYLATQPIMQAKEVFPFDKIPAPLKRKFRLDTKKDMGVDGLLQTTADEHHAYQVKFRSGRPSLTWTELSTFIGSSKKADKGLVFTNCNILPSNVEDMEEVYSVRGNDLDRLKPQDFEQILNWLKKTPKPKHRKEPREHQHQAIQAVEKALKGSASRRATVVMACGTGKTLIALWIAEKLGYKKILVLVPSLALLSQTLHEWMEETSWENLSYVCVCSDPTVTKGVDNWEVRQSDVDFPVGTDSKVVREFLTRGTGGVKVVFSTYQSAKVVAEGMDGKSFDLGIFDEAHKTTGREGTKFAFALQDENLPIERRLFLTATPRHFNVRQKDKEGESRLVYSMDDPDTYGSKVYELLFHEASERGIICDYKVLISEVTSDEVNEELLRRGEVVVEGDLVRARQVANQLALKNATERHPIKKAFTFHTLVNSARSFTAKGGEGLKAHLPAFETFHVSGSMPTAYREELLREFENAERAVMSNARCLTEGVNIPVVDMVAFMSPKKSRVDIVQAVGRAMRQTEDESKEYGFILIPLFLQTTDDESIEDAVVRSDFNEVWDVVWAMKEQDSELAEIISQMQVKKASTGAKGYDDQRFVEKVEVLGNVISLERLQKAITAKCIEKLGDSWDVRYGELVKYKEENGDCDVPPDYIKNLPLARWAVNQKMKYNKGELRPERIRRLEDLGFKWSTRRELKWEERYRELAIRNGNYGETDTPLFRWVKHQRKLYREGMLSQDQIRRLERYLDWGPYENHWEKMYGRLVEYRSIHRHCNVPQKYLEDPQLGIWVNNQREYYRKGTISADKIEMLEELDFKWDLREARWEEMYQELLSYKEEHGNCYVSERDPVYRRLASWIGRQRRAYRQGKLSNDRILKLEAQGLEWDSQSSSTGGFVRIRFEMSMRNQLPEKLNALGKRYGKELSLTETKPIWLTREVEWTAVPREGEYFRILKFADPHMVEEVKWDIDGVAIVRLEDFDADKVGDEYEALDMLLDSGWEVDLSGIG